MVGESPSFAAQQKFGIGVSLFRMVKTLSMGIGVLPLLIVCVAAKATGGDAANPYQRIVQRNVFGLEPANRTEPNPPARVELLPITLTGVTTILGKKQALMTVQAHPFRSYILGEGESDGDIEVLQIDIEAGAVQLSHRGVSITLTFAKHGPRLPDSAPLVPWSITTRPGYLETKRIL